MKYAIIESFLKGMENPPETVEGLMKKINDLTAGMRFSPLPDNEISRLAARFCPPEAGHTPPAGSNSTGVNLPAPNKARRASKKKGDDQ